MFLSYLVTCHNETDSLEKLLNKLIYNIKEQHEIILLDDYSDNPKTLEIIQKYKEKINFYQHKLDKNYGAHKNYGIELCKGEWIFQLDAVDMVNVFLNTLFEGGRHESRINQIPIK